MECGCFGGNQNTHPISIRTIIHITNIPPVFPQGSLALTREYVEFSADGRNWSAHPPNRKQSLIHFFALSDSRVYQPASLLKLVVSHKKNRVSAIASSY